MTLAKQASPSSLADQWEQLLRKQSDAVRRDLATRATLRARELGLAVVREAGDVDISLTLSPEIIEPAVIHERAVDARNVLNAVVKAARAVFSQGIEGPWSRMLFGHFGPLETACLKDWERAEDVTIARVDWFIDAAGRHHALELNATIPAMEAYSDAAARAWIETMARLAELTAAQTEALVQANGSNAEELRQSIVAHSDFAASSRPSIGIIHRASDSQLRELQALVRAFEKAGHVVRLAPAEEVSLNTAGRATLGSFVPDILYRHIFARRMPEGSVLERIARGETNSRLQNPVNGQFEVKGLLAELVRIVAEDNGAGLNLTAEELHTVKNVVPWTRLLSDSPGLGPNGERVSSLAEFVAADPAQFVLKKSWDYGGKSVLLGFDVLATSGAEFWRAKVKEALTDGPGAWVVQKLVASPRRQHLVVLKGTDAAWEDVYVDASTYSATGNIAVPGGGVTRFARTGVVNIVGGGGVAPLIRDDVAEQLLKAVSARA
jgi:hypothetical protein